MLKFLNKKKNDNKGFSLVELIIVVAILAILVGLLAPQYLKYVEKSRKSADASNLDEMVRAKTKLKSNKWDNKGTNADSISAIIKVAQDGGTTVTYTPDTLANYINKTAATTGK